MNNVFVEQPKVGNNVVVEQPVKLSYAENSKERRTRTRDKPTFEIIWLISWRLLFGGEKGPAQDGHNRTGNFTWVIHSSSNPKKRYTAQIGPPSFRRYNSKGPRLMRPEWIFMNIKTNIGVERILAQWGRRECVVNLTNQDRYSTFLSGIYHFYELFEPFWTFIDSSRDSKLWLIVLNFQNPISLKIVFLQDQMKVLLTSLQYIGEKIVCQSFFSCRIFFFIWVCFIFTGKYQHHLFEAKDKNWQLKFFYLKN